MVEIINSLQNKTIKNAAKLSEKKYRQQTGLFMLEGIKLVQELVDSSWQIDSVFIDKNLTLSTDFLSELNTRCANLYYVTPEIIAKISDVSSAQGIVAVAHMHNHPAEGCSLGEHDTVLLLENIQDPGNIGTIIRTAVATGVSAVIMTVDCADIYSPKVVRSSMGGLLRMPILIMDISEAIAYLRAQGFKIHVTSLHDATNLYSAQLSGKTAIVLGNEANGVSDYALAQADSKLFIPQIGKIESLNVSIAAGVIMYETLRQKINCGIYTLDN